MKDRNKKIKKRSFFNQVTLKIFVKSKIKPINVKLFKNGSIQMTGCKSILNIVEVLQILFNELKIIKHGKSFVNDINLLDIDHVINIQIVMINSYFNIEFKIDLNKLHDLLIENHYFCLYDSDKHAGVNIKYEYDDKSITILVFETGNIIITGATTCDQINEAYKFINKKILENFYRVIKYENEIDIIKLLANT
jgi:TATA-box binding protein (TBP) (component of TFIID and TFIIIB)